MTNKAIIMFLFLMTMTTSIKSQDIQATQITQNVIVIHGGGANITSVSTDEGIIVFDSFLSVQAAKQARDLISKHFPDKNIKYLINTHHHADHIRGSQCFSDANIIGHVNLEKHLMVDYNRLKEKYGHFDMKIKEFQNRIAELDNRTDAKAKELLEHLEFWKGAKAFMEEYVPTPPHIQLTGDATLTFGNNTFEILFGGTAHTDNDLVIFNPENRLLIMGDLLFYRKCYIMGPESDVKNWITILNAIIARSDEYKYVIPGHGTEVTDNTALIAQRDYLKKLYTAVQHAYNNGLTLDQALHDIQFENYKEYTDYDRIGLDIEACWQQLAN